MRHHDDIVSKPAHRAMPDTAGEKGIVKPATQISFSHLLPGDPQNFLIGGFTSQKLYDGVLPKGDHAL